MSLLFRRSGQLQSQDMHLLVLLFLLLRFVILLCRPQTPRGRHSSSLLPTSRLPGLSWPPRQLPLLQPSPLLKSPTGCCLVINLQILVRSGSRRTFIFLSITSLPPYQNFSFEELRLVDYKVGYKPLTVSSQARPSGQSTAPVTVCNPRAASFQPARPVASTSATEPSIVSISSTTLPTPGPVVARVVYRDRSIQTDIPRPPTSSVYVSATSSRATTPGLAIDDSGGIIGNSTFSLSEIKSQHTEPVLRPKILSCPFCHIGFNAVWEVSEHLETSSCPQRPDLNCSNIHRHQRQQDPNETMVLQTSDFTIETHLYHCPNTAEGCKAKFMSSFTELVEHLESESCGFIKREELWKDISECRNLWEGIGGY